MPARYRRTRVPSVWADANRDGARVDSCVEDPVFETAGNLDVTGITFGRIFRIDATSERDLVAKCDGEPNGMKLLNQRAMLVADGERRYYLAQCGPSYQLSPRGSSGLPVHRPFRGLLGVHSHYGLHPRAVTVFRDTLHTEGFSRFVSSMAASVASGGNTSPGGACTH